MVINKDNSGKPLGSNRKEVAVIVVPSVEQARKVLLASGLFVRYSESSVIDRKTGIEIRLLPLTGNS